MDKWKCKICNTDAHAYIQFVGNKLEGLFCGRCGCKIKNLKDKSK